MFSMISLIAFSDAFLCTLQFFWTQGFLQQAIKRMKFLKSIGILYLRPCWQNVVSQSFKKKLFLNSYSLTVYLIFRWKKENSQFPKDFAIVTGCDEEPPLGFAITPSLAFVIRNLFCVCVCVCMRACVFISFHRKGFS